MEKRTARGSVKPQCIALIGLPASGKTCVGSALARQLGLPFVDLDECIIAEDGRAIADMFKADGEEYFRRLESACLDRATRGGKLILSTGGGCVLAPGNRYILMERCTVVWLDLSPEVAAARAEGVGKRGSGRDARTAAALDAKAPAVRPLLAGGDIVERMKTLDSIRRPLYRECADIVVQVEGKSPAAIVEELYAAMD
jgi:shikimate kinase